MCFFFFSTDGKSFAEFLFLLEEEKSERAMSPLKQYNNPQESKGKEQTKVFRPATHFKQENK